MQRQNNRIRLNLETGATGEARSAAAQEAEIGTAEACLERPAAAGPSMESIVERNNMRRALEQVRRNKGAPGADGMTVNALASYLKEHWSAIRAQLLGGTYRPQPVRRVEIPKASGGVRRLGIPCVNDRLIQQAALQVLQVDWDPTFSEHSYVPAGSLGASSGETGAGTNCVWLLHCG
jgi:RNA-directed DNA polymerase